MTSAPLSPPVGVRTRLVDDPGRLIDLLPDEQGPLAWVRRGDGLVGWGEVARFTVAGPHRFTEADAWWRGFVADLQVDDRVGVPGTGPVAFAGFTFADDSPGSVLVVPRIVVGRRDGLAWVTEFTGPADRTDHRRAAAAPGGRAVRPVRPVRPTGPLRFADGVLSATGYRGVVAEAVLRMRAGGLAKVVLAHDLLAVGDDPIDPRFLLGRLAERYPTCWTYAVDGWVGATPELLVRRSGTEVRSRVLAGTIWPGRDTDTGGDAGGDGDGERAAAGDRGRMDSTLLGSVKNRHEHALAVESLAATLRPHCASLHVPDTPSVIRLPNVSHLCTDVHGALDARRPASLLELVAAVHPTAAVGGTPRGSAVALIAELEAMDRGRYAGPTGWIDAAGDGELGIALRCAHVVGATARLFAGGGIVPDSVPDTEVREAAAKMVAVRDALEDGVGFGDGAHGRPTGDTAG